MEKLPQTKQQTSIAATSSADILRIFSPKNCLKFSNKVNSIEQAIEIKAPSIVTFKRHKGTDFTISFIVTWLIYLNQILDLRKPMTEDQIEMCATMILQEFGSLKITDLTLLFKRIISGKFGSFYESLGIDKVLSFFREYYQERLDIAERISESQHNDFKSDDTFNYSSSVERIYRGSKGFNSQK